MNIFYVNTNPILAAQQLCDKHVVKLIVESAQLLATALHLNGYCATYKPTHKSHPSTLWTAESEDNYAWVYEHLKELCNEYTRRYGKVHKTQQYLTELQTTGDWTKHSQPPQCMPDDYKQEDTVLAYQAYYRGAKSYMAKWNYSKKPTWFFIEELI